MRRPPNTSTTEYHLRSRRFQSPEYSHTLRYQGNGLNKANTREYETDQVGEDLSAIIQEDEEEVDKANTESKKDF